MKYTGLVPILILILLAAPIRASDEAMVCLSDGSACVGERVFVVQPGKAPVFAEIEKFITDKATGKLQVRAGGVVVPRGKIAGLSRPDCTSGKKEICPGDEVETGGSKHLVTAVTPDGDVIYVDSKNKKALSAPAKELKRTNGGAYQQDLMDAVKAANLVQNLLKDPDNLGCAFCIDAIQPAAAVVAVAPAPPVAALKPKTCDEKPGPVTADDSAEKSYFEELLKKGEAAPLSDFLHFWYPERNRTVAAKDDYILSCQTKPWEILGKSWTFDHHWFSQNTLKEKCKPDTLYSWGPEEKLTTLKAAHPDAGKWSGPVNPYSKYNGGLIYTSVSASGTYMYGKIPVRFKIRQDVPFIEKVHEGEKGKVGVRSGYFNDFTFNDAAVIESWSYGTPEHYDEIIRDIQRHISGKNGINYIDTPPQGFRFSRIYNFGNIDGHDNSETTLKQTLLGMIRMILKGEGRIQYSAGACRSRAGHFSTRHPSYINPN